MILRLIGWQGIAGIAASALLFALLLVQKGETRHWRKHSAQFEQLYRSEQTALAGTVANYRAAAEAARAADRAHAERAAAEQRAINERTLDAYEARLAAARTRAGELRREAGAAATHPGSGGSAPVPRVSTASTGTADTAAQDRLLPEDALIATEQAIQLDELIKWVKDQARIDQNRGKD